jgi:hypothetical protein
MRSGNPADTDPCGWRCGFYPGSYPRECTSGTAATFDQARIDFEEAWRDFLADRTEADFDEYRKHGAWTAWKYAMWDSGCKLPTQVASGQFRCFCGAGLATGDATSSIMAISWVGPPLTFKIYPDARQGSPWHFRAPATVPARRDRPLTRRDQAACDRPAGWRPMPLPRCCDVAASIPCANLSRSADLGRRGNAGSGHIAPGGGNRRKGLAVSSARKNRPGSRVLRHRNITVFRVYEGFDQAALLTSRRREVCDWPYQEADADRRRQPRPTPRRIADAHTMA